MTPFFHKEVLGEKIIILVKHGNVFTQIRMFLLKKVDDLGAREQEGEEKGTTNFGTNATCILYIYTPFFLGMSKWRNNISLEKVFKELDRIQLERIIKGLDD